MTNVYAQAVKYASLGWSVIPLKPGSKEPLLPWREYQTRLPTVLELKTWFEGTKNNIGIVTGLLSNLAVLDVDTTETLPGMKEIHSGISVLTKRGRHLYFHFNGETNSASKIMQHVDVRGEGGFVVASPSVVDGHKYRFLSPVFNTKSLCPFPKELLDVNTKSDDGGNINGHKPLSFKETVSIIEEGGPRTPNFVKVIGRLRYDGHTPDDIFALLTPLAKARDYDISKLRELIDDAEKRYPNDRPTTGYEIHTQGSEAENITTFLEGDEKPEWIVPHMVAKSSIGFCAGLPESYKTWIMAELSIQAAIGGSWLGQKVNQTRTLFVDQERFKGETRRRFKKLMLGKGIKASDLQDNLFIQTGSSVRLNMEESFNAFRRKLSDIKPEMIIIDSFATIHTSSENDRQEIQKVLEKVKQLRQEFGCTVIFIDHENKSVLNPEMAGDMPTAFTMVGSVGKPAAAETVFTVRKDKANTVTLYHTKSTMDQSVPPIQVQLIDTDNGGVKLVHG